MGLDAMGKAQGPRRVQDAFPCIPSQPPTVVLSVMMNTQLMFSAWPKTPSCVHSPSMSWCLWWLTWTHRAGSWDVPAPDCYRDHLLLPKGADFPVGQYDTGKRWCPFQLHNSRPYTNCISCFQPYVFPLFSLFLMPRLFPQVMAIAPTHYIWQRERSVHHSGARRNYDEGAQLPRGPSATPTDCLLCGKKGRFVRLGLSSSSSSTDTLEMIELHSSQKSKDTFSAEKMLIDSPYKAQGMV